MVSYRAGSMPCALITGMAVDQVRNFINCFVDSRNFEFALVMALNKK